MRLFHEALERLVSRRAISPELKQKLLGEQAVIYRALRPNRRLGQKRPPP